MENGKTILPAAQPVSSGASGVSAPFSILPEKFAERTGALGQAMFHLIAAPVTEQSEAMSSVRFDSVAHSFEHILQEASNSVQSMNATVGETLRKSIEQSVHFMEDLSQVKAPSDILRLQFGFLSGQMQLFAENARNITNEFGKLLTPPKIGRR